MKWSNVIISILLVAVIFMGGFMANILSFKSQVIEYSSDNMVGYSTVSTQSFFVGGKYDIRFFGAIYNPEDKSFSGAYRVKPDIKLYPFGCTTGDPKNGWSTISCSTKGRYFIPDQPEDFDLFITQDQIQYQQVK